MNLLPLNDPRWKDLCHRNWSEGQPSISVPDAPFVPDILSQLVKQPERTDIFDDLWPWLCSEGTAWSAAYATVPYAVYLASSVSLADRFKYLYFTGLVAMCSCPDSGSSFEIEPYLTSDYEAALNLALPMVAEIITHKQDLTETCYILSTISALKGHIKLANVLGNIAYNGGECENIQDGPF
jgi:hypothetical protein